MWDRYIARGESVMEPEVPFTEFRVGSQFFILNRVHSLMVVKDRTLWKKFRLPCLNVGTCYPEEHYFPTLLWMKDPTRVSKETLTRVDWTGSVDGHPRSYDPSEVTPEMIKELRGSNTTEGSYLFARKFSPELTPEMIKELRGSNTTEGSYLFARKFSPECLPVLMDMADDVIFRE
nr:glycosyl transferase, family 14 [Tanacetum cinerariifolium]